MAVPTTQFTGVPYIKTFIAILAIENESRKEIMSRQTCLENIRLVVRIFESWADESSLIHSPPDLRYIIFLLYDFHSQEKGEPRLGQVLQKLASKRMIEGLS